jgi:DNA-binding MarR family transcriptional regulator
LSTQVFSSRAQLEGWIRFLRAHAALTRALSADLVAQHGLTLNEYEVLLHLSRAPEQALKRVDLAERVLLTASGMTRLLDRLEDSGLVERASCPTDRRVVYAKLTTAGARRLREAARTHVAGVDELFLARFTEEEMATLTSLLGRLPGVDGDSEPGPDCDAE